ncbi:Protein kinase domain [Carpediemonas membranifera]|uniref:Protein kinase domain n=1 Tax=Carpediemonas membranifera TaxID=201153 RepID=A0A8J6DYJ7_9EUKA|nr:Protein kinase domain [Carpediemonas membranifera]|eukprot:KAG9392364.1 Protein kinase domain [Carpediemonas membranifera]
MITQPVVRIEAAFSRSDDCRAVDAQIRTAISERPGPEGIQVRKRGETPITVQDLEQVVQYLLSAGIEPDTLTMELTEPAVTVTMVDGRLEADHEDGSVELALEAWNTRFTEPMAGMCLKTLTGHGKQVLGVATSPDGTIITASPDGTVKQWDSATGQCIRTMTHGGQVYAVAVSPDGSTIASGGRDNLVKLWDAATGQQTQTLSGHTGFVWRLAFSSDGRTLVSGSDDTTAKVWDVERGQCRLTLTGHGHHVRGVAISPDGSTIYTGSIDSTIKQWSSATGACIRTMNHGAQVYSIAVSPDGAIVASGGSDGSVKFWDTATGQLTRTLDGHTNFVCSLAFSPDGRTLASGSADKTIKQWDVATGALIRTLSGHDGTVQSVAFSRANSTIVSGSDDRTAKVWSTLPRIPQFLATVNQRCSSPVAPDADIAIDPGDSAALTCDLARILLHFLATGLPRSFTMTLTHPAARVWLENKFAETDSEDAGLAKIIRSFNASLRDQVVSDLCSGAVSDVFLIDATVDQLRQVVTHVSSHAVPSSFTVTTADPATTVTLTDGLFSADRHALEVDAILSDGNFRLMLQTAMAEQEHNMGLLRAELSDLKATLASFCASPQTGRFTEANRAADISAMLEGHPLLSAAIPAHDGVGPIPSPAGLISRLGHARRQPETRIAEYEAVIAQARAGVEALEATIAAVSADYQAASAIVDGATAFEPAADNEVVGFPTLAPELQARYATLRAFLQQAVRETWQWALGRKELGDDTSAEERTIRELTGLAAEAEVHVAGFAEADAITAQLQTLGDYQHLKSKAEELEDDVSYLRRRRRHAQAAEVAAELEAVNASIAEINAVLARRTPQLVRLCPELKVSAAPSASLFAELREMGLAHLMDLPEMRADQSLSDFAVESTVSENRALCQIVARDGQTYFAKTFKLDSAHQRKLCDREAGILSRMAHSPAVPRLHFVLLDLSDHERKTGAIVMERLERHLRDAPADSPDTQRRLLRGLLTAIHDLHSAGVCHRDLKPENVMLREGHPVLVDFETASNMDAVNATATGVNIGTLAFSAPEEIAARKAGKKLSHREQQAADVYHAGLTTLGAMAPDYFDFNHRLLSLITSDLAAASTVNDDQLCTALLAAVAVPDALREVLSGMLATHPEARWSVRRALADGLFTASANELDPEVDLNAASSRFASAHAFVDDIDRARLQMFREEPIDIALADDVSASLASIAACEEDLFAIPATLSGDDSAKALPDLVVELRPVLLGLGRVLQLMLLDGITLPADMVSDAWLVALTGGRVDLGALMPIVARALQRSVAEAAAACPLEGFEGDLKARGDEVRRRFAERMQIVRNGMAAKTRFSAKVLALTAAQLRALLVRPNPLTVAAVLAPLRFPADSQGVQDALRAVLEDDETRRRFAFHVFGGQLPQPASVGVTLHDDHRVYADCAGGAHLPRLEDADQMRQAVLDSAPATAVAAADFYVIPRRVPYSRAEIDTLAEQNDILQTCRLVTLGRGAAVDVPVIRRCPTCGELTTREGDLDSCKMSACPCGQDFCHKCLLCVASQEEHMAHYGGECEMAPRQTVDLPEGVARLRTFACPHCHRSATVSANRRQLACRGCGNTVCLGHDDPVIHDGSCEHYDEMLANRLGYRRCPGCGVRYYKDGGCQHMRCRCGHTWNE